jgi:hypothetical protein
LPKQGPSLFLLSIKCSKCGDQLFSVTGVKISVAGLETEFFSCRNSNVSHQNLLLFPSSSFDQRTTAKQTLARYSSPSFFPISSSTPQPPLFSHFQRLCPVSASYFLSRTLSSTLSLYFTHSFSQDFLDSPCSNIRGSSFLTSS